MIRPKQHYQSGFSAVELLITLFVAAAFIATGYQLYYAVIEASGETRSRALVHNSINSNIQFYTFANRENNSCALFSYFANLPSSLNVSSETNAVYATQTQPYSWSNKLCQITFQAKFRPVPGGQEEIVRHAQYFVLQF